MKKRVCIALCVLLLPALALAGDYVIGDGDGLQISVWGEPSLSGAALVRPDGKITLPAVGDVVATGRTPAELSQELTEKLKEFVKVPIVTVTVSGINNSKVYVFGGGPGSGVHSLPGRTTLLKFLAGLGDLRGADLKRAYLMRDGEKIHTDFYALFVKGDLSNDIQIHPDDIIYIPDNASSKVYVIGAVKNPQYVNYREDLRVLDAILESGGFTEFASENKVLIMRKDEDQIKEIKVKVKDLMKEGDLANNVTLKPGDYVVVKEGLF
ncbi:MAG: polysaccharide biosynthesis/export family protein [Nitrospirota bacterium]|jgi:polysaccharide export outer membrane protein